MAHTHVNPRTGKETSCKATPGNCPLEARGGGNDGGGAKGGQRYHVNPKTGKSSVCHASVRGCPLGGDDVHFSSKERALQGAEDMLKEEYGGTVATQKKGKSMHTLVEASPEDRGAQDGEPVDLNKIPDGPARVEAAIKAGRPLYTFNERTSRIELDPAYERARRDLAQDAMERGTPLFDVDKRSGKIQYDPYYQEAMMDAGKMPRPIPLTQEGHVDTAAENERWSAAAIAKRARRSPRARASFDNARSAMEESGLLLQGANRQVQDRVKPRSEKSRAAWRQALSA